MPGSRRAGLHVALDSAHALLDQIHAGREAEADVLLSFASIAAAKTGSRKDCHAGLVEQAIGPKGAVRLDYVPPAAQLNLAEAQLSARARLIELAVGELRRLRPST